MTKLPAKELLEGTKNPETTTGEFRLAMGNLRQFLFELFGEEGSDKETARQTLGIDLAGISTAIAEKADKQAVEAVREEKADRSELDSKADMIIKVLKQEITKNRVPVGTIAWFAASELPVGYLKADGSSVWRETYPELFAVIGTTYGSGNGAMTFNLPNLIGRFVEGSATPGTVKEAGLPNIKGILGSVISDGRNGEDNGKGNVQGAFLRNSYYDSAAKVGASTWTSKGVDFDASRSNPIYGNSSTVQPPSLTLLPCIKAFYA